MTRWSFHGSSCARSDKTRAKAIGVEVGTADCDLARVASGGLYERLRPSRSILNRYRWGVGERSQHEAIVVVGE
jgi:hypothetical protein